MVRPQVQVCAAYGTDSEKVRSLLVRVVTENPYVLESRAPFAVLGDFGESGESCNKGNHDWCPAANARREISQVKFE